MGEIVTILICHSQSKLLRWKLVLVKCARQAALEAEILYLCTEHTQRQQQNKIPHFVTPICFNLDTQRAALEERG